MRRASRDQGFTLVEVLAALVFLGILMPVVLGALTLSNRAGVRAERSTVAVQLAENRLNEMLLGQAWIGGESRGDFGTDHPGYRWELARGDWQPDDMVELTMRVFFEVQGRPHEVGLTTLVSETEDDQP